jgi:uncharacterized membrane protein
MPDVQELRDARIHRYFLIGVYLKGFHSLLEIMGGLLLLVLSPALSFLPHFIALITQEELTEDPNDLLANYLVHMATRLSLSTELFAAAYLLVHGIVRLFLAVMLLRGKMWAYPWSIGVIGLFVLYQLYRFTHTHSIWLIVLSIIDIAVLYFIWREYQVVRAHADALLMQ